MKFHETTARSSILKRSDMKTLYPFIPKSQADLVRSQVHRIWIVCSVGQDRRAVRSSGTEETIRFRDKLIRPECLSPFRSRTAVRLSRMDFHIITSPEGSGSGSGARVYLHGRPRRFRSPLRLFFSSFFRLPPRSQLKREV